MPEFRTRYLVGAPLSAVAEFHWREDALACLTPPPLRLEVLQREPLAEGSRLRFCLRLGPVAVMWEARHVDVDPQRGFTDEQVEGPQTGIPNLWLVGDSVFPGQSTAGVILGAARVVAHLLGHPILF